MREALVRLDGNVSRAVYGRTMLFISLVACFLVIIVVAHVSHVEHNLLESTALDQAAKQLREVDQFRAADLSARVPSDDARVYKSNPHTAAAAPPVPGTFEFSLADRLMRSTDSGTLRLYSPYPFPSNPHGGLPDKFGAQAWNVLRDAPDAPFYRFVQSDGRDTLRYAVAEVMRPQCVSCHNDSPWSRKRDWQVGDVAGILEVEVPRRGATLLARSTAIDTLLLLTILTGSGLAALAFLVRRLKTTAAEAHGLASRTDQINRQLEREVEHRSRAEKALSTANERLSANHAQLERWAADLEIAHSRLREIDDLKTKFLSEVSHELRSPVAAIVSAAKIITKHHGTKPEVVERFGKTIVSEGERMTRLINDFLDLTKIEAGCTDWRDSEVDVETLANEVLLNAGALALEGDIQLIQAVDANLPKLHMDGDRLMQVLTNLMNNAIKHTPSGGSITLRASVNGKDMQFAVDDTGPGIPAEEAAKLFDRFRQVRNENTDGKKRVGTGLGLAISREIVQHYGGRIWIESEVGHGSSFCFTLPLQRDGVGGGEGNTDKTQNGNGGSARVLIFLDDLEEAKTAARVGTAAGLECRTCTTVEEVVTLRDKWTPDAYVISVNRLQASDALLARVRSDAVSKLLVYSSEHGLTAPSLLDSAELLVPSLRGLISQGARVLVVEDDEKYRGLLAFELQQAGYKVTTASDGRDALTHIRNHAADAVILDLIMPGMDGLAVLERLASSGGVDVPILVYTAMDDPSVALAAKDLGATEVFRKDTGGGVVYTAVAARVRRALADVLSPHTRAGRSDGGLKARGNA